MKNENNNVTLVEIYKALKISKSKFDRYKLLITLRVLSLAEFKPHVTSSKLTLGDICKDENLAPVYQAIG